MNDKLWKTIQILSPIFIAIIFGISLLAADLDRKPDGGWQATFPSKVFQIAMVILFVIFTFTWICATFVRKEGEVSLLAVKRGILSLIGGGLFVLILQYILH